MLMLLIPLYFVSLHEAEQRTLDIAGDTLKNGMELFEKSLQSAATAADSLWRESRVYKLSFLSESISPADAYAIYEGLQSYQATACTLSMCVDTGMHFSNGALIAGKLFFRTAQDAFSPLLSSSYIYEYDGMTLHDFEQWMDLLDITGRPLSLTSLRMGTRRTGIEDRIVYALSLPLNTPANSTFFYASYNAQDLLNLLVLAQYQDACALTLCDSQGHAFLSHCTTSSDRMVEVTYESPLYRLNATLRIDRAVFSSQMHAFRATLLAGAIFYAFIGFALSLLFSWHNTKPVVKVIHAAEQTGLESGVALEPPLQPVNSYQYIHSLIDSMGREVTAARHKQELQMVQLQESMFDRLLRGDLHHESGLNQARSFFPDFPACSCMILVRLLHSHQMDIATFSDAQLRLNDIIKSHLPSGVRIHLFSNLTVLICPCEETRYHEMCSGIISGFMPHLSEQTDLNVRFAVSTPLHDISELSRVFQQLRHLLHIVGDTDESVFFAQESEPTAAQEHSYSSTRFYEILLRGEGAVALALMEEDVRRLKQDGIAHETEIQQLFFIYRHELMRVREEFQLTAPAGITPPALPDYLPQLSVDELFGELRRCGCALSECINASRVSERESFERRLLSYIDAHLSDPTLCIQSVIDPFSISESTLRNILSRTAGMNFSEYVEHHRMHKAQLLVERSVMPVSQIPQQCGYASANTFYKAFKRHFGMSPSSLRAQAQSGADSASE